MELEMNGSQQLAGKGAAGTGLLTPMHGMSDGVICLVPAKQGHGLEEMYPLPKPSHVQNSSKRGHVGMAFWPFLVSLGVLSISSGF